MYDRMKIKKNIRIWTENKDMYRKHKDMYRKLSLDEGVNILM
jgi:hypothetical protein